MLVTITIMITIAVLLGMLITLRMMPRAAASGRRGPASSARPARGGAAPFKFRLL